MRKWKLALLSMLMIIFFSSNIVYAKSIFETTMENPHHEEHVKEKRDMIKHHKKMNKKLEKQIDKKLKEVEKIFIELSNNNIVAQEEFEKNLDKKMNVIMNELMEISEVEMSMWNTLKTANRQLKAGNHESGMKNLNKTIEQLEKKHEMLVKFSQTLDEFIIFLKSVQHK